MKSLRDIAATTKAKPPLEASVTKACLEYLNALPRSRFQKRWGTRARGSDPDISGCLDGQHWEIECKRFGKRPSERQFSSMQKWSEAGAVVCWVSSKRELESIVQLWYQGRGGLGQSHPNRNADVRNYAHNLI